MLIQFSVENFRSIKNKALFSMEAAKNEDHAVQVATIGKERILKTAAIFGANAAGKSNIFAALTAAILMVRLSNTRQVEETLNMITPFAFSKETMEKPSSFEFVFLASGKKYVYGFSATREKVTKEYLYVYHSLRASTVFERTEEEYRFTNPSIKKELEPISHRNTPNKLFLATATAWNAKSTQTPCLWFNLIDTYTNNYGDLIAKDISMLENDTDQKLNHFICDLLAKADMNISAYEYKSQDEPAEKWLSRFPAEVRTMMPPEMIAGKHKVYTILMTHQVENHPGNAESWQLNLNEESQGTKSLFMLSPVLYDAFLHGKIICIDEFDTSLHPLLVGYLVSLFHDPAVNTGNAQLIISSYTTTLLSHRFLRDDEIYFVEKDKKTGVSDLYSLDEFSPRKQMNIRKAYLLGRFGAIPEIENGEIVW